MTLTFLANEKPLFGLVSLNVVLETLVHWMIKAGPVLGSVLQILQLVAAAATVYHIARKAWKDRKHEKKLPPPDSTGAGI